MSVLNINTNNALNLYIQNVDNSYYNNLITTSSATLTYVNSSNIIKSSVYDNNAIYYINEQTNPNINTTINYEKIEAIQPYSIKSNTSVCINSSNIYIIGVTDIIGSLKFAGSAGTNGQVLTSNGSTAEWTTIISGWVGTATSNLDMATYSILNTSSIDTNNLSLKLGNTSASGVIIGRAGQITDISGNLHVAGSAGTNGQVLTSNGTTAEWTTIISGWVETATSNLDMATYSIINTSSIDTNNLSLKLGNTSASGVIIGRAGQITDISGNLRVAGSAGTNGQVLTSNGTTAEWTTIISGWVETATSNLDMATYSIINTSSIDTNNLSLKLGNTSASGVIIGRAGQITDISGNLRVAGSAGTNGQVLTSNGTTAEWSSPASGWTGTATSNLSMGSYAITGTSLDASSTGVLIIGSTNATGINIGKTGINTTVTGTLISTTSTINTVNVQGNGTNMTLWSGSISGTANILTNATRTGTTNMLTGSSANTFNLGGQNTTTNFSGLAINFTAAKNTFTNLSAVNVSMENLSAVNLSVNNTSIYNLSVLGTAKFFNGIAANARSEINNLSSNNVSILNLSVKNNATFVNDVSVNGLTQLNNVSSNNVSIYNLSVKNNTTFVSDVSVNGLTQLNDVSSNNVSILNLSVKSNATFISDVSVNGLTQLNDVSSNNVSISNLSVKSNATFVSNVSINGLTQLNNVSSNNVSILNLSVKNNATFDNEVLVTGQTTFSTPPHVPNPRFGNDAASKGYVDSLVGQYSGGFNLFFNYSETDTRNSIVYGVLSQTVSNAVQTTVDTSITTGQVLVAQFITPQLNITSIPAGLWNTLIYGAVNDTTDTITYSFTLSKISAGNLITPLATESSNSIDINASPNSNPIAYTMNMTISTAISLVLTDSLIISIYINRTGTGSAIAVRTYFENTYYSFTQSTLNAGTTLLSSNNVWTGTNDFLIGITSQTLDTSGSSTLTLGGTNATTTTLGRSTGTTNIQGNLQVAGSAGSNNQVLTSNGTTAAWAATQWVPTATSALNMGTYKINANEIDVSTTGSKDYKLFFSATSTDEIYIGNFNTTNTENIIIGRGNQPLLIGTSPDRTSIINIGHNSTLSNTINIGSATSTNTIRGSTLNLNSTGGNVNIGTSGSATLNMGSATTTTNIKGSTITIGTQGSNNQVLTSNGTTSTWQATQWVGTATTDLDMVNKSIINASSLDTNNISLKLGNTSASGVIIGRAGQITDISGNLQIAGSAGSNNQVLTSNGTTAIWQATQWVGTATTDLDMVNKSIINASSLDTNNLSLKLGNTSASGVIIGRAGQITDISGNLQIAGSAGSNNQVLTSNGTTAAWAATQWVPTATSDLSMGIYKVNTRRIGILSTGSITNTLWEDAGDTDIIRIGSEVATNTTRTFIAANNGVCNIGNTTGRTANINIGNAITFGGSVQICQNDVAPVTTSICKIGSSKTTLSLCNYEGFDQTINIASAATSAGTINIGSATTITNIKGATLTIGQSGQTTNINGTVTIANTPTINTNIINLNTANDSWARLNIPSYFQLKSNNNKGIQMYLGPDDNYSSMLFFSKSSVFRQAGRFEMWDNANGNETNADVRIIFNSTTITNNVNIGTVQAFTNAITNTVNIGTSTTTLNIGCPITPTYTAVPTVNNIGYNYTAITIASSTISGTAIVTIPSSNFTISAGTWIAELSSVLSVINTPIQIGISSTSGTFDITRTSSTHTANIASVWHLKMTTVIQQTANVTWYILGQRGNNNITLTNIKVILTRIA
jgi:uncharacterized protein YfkK (UPF0435 family)